MVAAELSFSAKDSLQIPATGGFLTFSFLLPLASADRKMPNGESNHPWPVGGIPLKKLILNEFTDFMHRDPLLKAKETPMMCRNV